MRKTFGPGVRFSATDAMALVLAIVAVVFAASYAWWLSACIALAVGHFFLFCNVFRIARNLELIWAAAFVALVSCTVLWDWPGWVATFAVLLSVTVIVVAIEMRKPTYHGWLWRRINPDLPAWPPRADGG